MSLQVFVGFRSEESIFCSHLVSNMSVEKQLDAAQKFLRGITSFASYAEVTEKQAHGVQRSLEKGFSF